LDFLSLIIEVFTFLLNQDFSTLSPTSNQDIEISLSSKSYFIAIFIEIGEVEALRVLFENLGDEVLELLKIFGVGRLDDMDFLSTANFEKHQKNNI